MGARRLRSCHVSRPWHVVWYRGWFLQMDVISTLLSCIRSTVLRVCTHVLELSTCSAHFSHSQRLVDRCLLWSVWLCCTSPWLWTEYIWLGTGPQLLNYPRNHFCWLRKACSSWSLLGYCGRCILTHSGDADPRKVDYENSRYLLWGSGWISAGLMLDRGVLSVMWKRKPLCWPKTGHLQQAIRKVWAAN